MRYNIRQNGSVTIVDLSGRFGLSEAAPERELTLHLVIRDLVASGSRKLVLNLGGVTHIDSAGIGEFVACFTTVRSQGGALKIVNPPKQVKELLRLTRVDMIIDVIGDEAAAVNSYRRVIKAAITGASCFEP